MSVYNKFPNLQQGINQEFIGLGHTLQDKRNQRKKVLDQEKLLANRVLYFEKQAIRTNKSIEEHKRKLEEVINIRNRRENEKREKQMNEMLRQQQLSRLRLQSQFIRRQNIQNKSQALRKLKNRNKKDFLRVKQRLQKQFQFKKEWDDQQQMNKTNNFKIIKDLKKKGAENINEFKKNKNKQFVRFYKTKIKQEEESKNTLLSHIQNLSKREDVLISSIQKSHLKKQKLQDTLQNAYTLQIDKLEQVFQKMKPKSGFRSARTSYGTHKPRLNSRDLRLSFQNNEENQEELKRQQLSQNKQKDINIDSGMEDNNPQRKSQKKKHKKKKRSIAKDIEA